MKKTFWENRVIAWVVFAACVLFSISFSGGRALFNLRADTERVFYQGVNNDGLCIDKDLAARADAAYKLASVAANYSGIDSQLTGQVRDASNQLAGATTISQKYEANQLCGQLVEDLYSAMEKVSLSKDDKTFASKQYKEIQSRADTISRDNYNDQAKEFNGKLGAFPASIIGNLSGVKPLELFAAG